MSKTLLLTGASGFLGRNCLDVLDGSGWQVHAVDREPLSTVSPGVQWHEADLLEGHDVVDLLVDVRPTHLLHLAWTGSRPVYGSPENFRWVGASLRLFQEFVACGGRRLVAAGSSAEYRWNGQDCDEEGTEIFGDSAYGICKSALGRMFVELCRVNGVSGAWARPFFLYGPYENPTRLVPSVITALLDGRPALCTHGRQVRDYLYSRDAAEALVWLLESPYEGVVNVASGRGVAVSEIVELISRRLEREDLVRLGAVEAPANEASRVVADARRLRHDVGWSPGYSLEGGIDETIAWWRDELGDSARSEEE
jgi:nucleoside-diphosphate-sugar epimerase